MAIVAVVYLTIPRIVLAPFFDTHDDQSMDTAVKLLLVAAVLQFFDCTRNIGVGLLRGLDDTKGGFRAPSSATGSSASQPPRCSASRST
jgi:MATE family multidrug resistance protein